MIEETKQKREEKKKERAKELAIEHRWINMSHAFSQKALGKSYIIESLVFTREHIIGLCSAAVREKRLSAYS